jgi:hypothetical protein
VVLHGRLEGAEPGPSEAADEAFVDVGESGVGEVVAQVVEVGPGAVGADCLTGRLGAWKAQRRCPAHSLTSANSLGGTARILGAVPACNFMLKRKYPGVGCVLTGPVAGGTALGKVP